ncbi:hypothetical protein HCU74_16220 [Spongiibacter sp. KMU-166]|uniref:Uncharacterized protein n=1 Tax=Spongiibacter thalassae TaxID=2721624 RepID=A0ABX1GLB8_9GAMM|nr:hypothetical protein [Spongiibacter thalassae]NKI18954.1 hypothetical protein [Spongiibacter thalassae]
MIDLFNLSAHSALSISIIFAVSYLIGDQLLGRLATQHGAPEYLARLISATATVLLLLVGLMAFTL